MVCVNNKVYEHYMSGMTLNDAILEEFKDEIQDRIQKDDTFKDFSPKDFVMFDAGITKYSKIDDIVKATTNSLYTSGGMESNEWLFPAWVDSTLHEAVYESDIINYLVSTTIGVDSNIVKSAMLDLTSDKNRNAIKRARVAESADLPLAKIVMGEKAITLWKHGRAIETSYEATRRMTIPMWQRHMAAIVADLAHQNLEAATDVIVNGDGNNNAAIEIADVASAGLTASGLIDALIDYWAKNHYSADTIVAGPDDFKKLVKMTFDVNQVPGASNRLSFNIPQIGTQNVTVLMANTAIKIGNNDIITLSNRANSLIRYTENGSNIQEAQAFIRNQTNLMTFSENSGYAIGTAGSNMYITTKKGS